MPIQLDDITSITDRPVKSVGPTFFSKSLTGDGGSRPGLISERLRPGRYPLGSSRTTLAIGPGLDRKARSTHNGWTNQVIPLDVLTQSSYRQENLSTPLTMPAPHAEDRFHVTAGRANLPMEAHLDLVPQSILIDEDHNGEGVKRYVHVLYRMEVYLLAPGSTSIRIPLSRTPSPVRTHEFAMAEWSFAPLDDAEDLIAAATRYIAPTNAGVLVDTDALAEWMAGYDVHERISRLAEQWSTTGIAETMDLHVTELFAAGQPPADTLNVLAAQLRYLETYNVSLESYRLIHQSLKTHTTEEVLAQLAKQNLNLLMSLTLEHLDTMRPRLVPPPPAASGTGAVPKHFSTQQRNAISTEDPLVLVQAGAGTGKSSVIMGRIENLVSRGVTPSDITVLSFTNAAADNITDRVAKAFPNASHNVTSMTIARMIHDIYSLNHPTHELSSMDTIMNSLDIFYPSDSMAQGFRRHLMDVAKGQSGATTALNAFIEKYFEQIVAILDTLGQTCLELEIIVAYQRIDTMAEPAHVQSRYLIVDEVQDNSVFEFIYMLKYVAKHAENMLIVGDAAQTLYEFRASNPRAMNALEGSGVFKTYQLTTNYRSNQEILDFANIHLADIEANQSAGLRLQANSLAMPTVDSFRRAVRLEYRHGTKLAEFTEHYPAYLRTITGDYIAACLDRGEQVAFLMFTRDMVRITEETLATMYPGRQIANLVSEKNYSTTVFSQFIKMYWGDVQAVPHPANASLAISKMIMDNLSLLTKNSAKAGASVQRMVSNWWVENGSTINGWVKLEASSSITRQEFFDNLRQNVLDHEIRHNAVKQSLMNQKNRERKERNTAAKADLVVSTIHGAKGLEFDNVVVVHKFDPKMGEEAKRMYYVALTRAVKSEFVLSYGTVKKPRILSDYDLIIAALAKRDALTALRAQGLDLDTLSEDEVEAALAAMPKVLAAVEEEKPRSRSVAPAAKTSAAVPEEESGDGDAEIFTGDQP